MTWPRATSSTATTLHPPSNVDRVGSSRYRTNTALLGTSRQLGPPTTRVGHAVTSSRPDLAASSVATWSCSLLAWKYAGTHSPPMDPDSSICCGPAAEPKTTDEDVSTTRRTPESAAARITARVVSTFACASRSSSARRYENSAAQCTTTSVPRIAVMTL